MVPVHVLARPDSLTLTLSLSLSLSLSHARFALVRSFARCPKGFPTFIPSEFVDEIVEPAALDVLRNMQMAALDVEGLGAVKDGVCARGIHGVFSCAAGVCAAARV